MAWSNSKVFAIMIDDKLSETTAMNLETDDIKAALYNNTITPSNTVTAANSAYNVDQWATAQEQYEAGQWAQGGVSLTGPEVVQASTTITFDDDDSDTASGANADLSNCYGCLVYSETIATPVANQGICYNYFGGTAYGVTDGTFTIVWNASGIFSISVA